MLKLAQRSYTNSQGIHKKLSIFQWNTLSDQLAYNFPAVSPELLKWEYRSPKLLKKIQEASADIMCLQEIDHYYDFFKPQLEKLGYIGVYQKKGAWHQDGCCIFFKNHYKKIEEYAIKYPGNQVAVGVLIECGNCPLYVFSTHLKSKVGFDWLRKEQAEVLLNYIENLQQYPVLVCGDFNSQPYSIPYKAMYENRIGLKSIFHDREPEFTTIKYRKSLEKKTEDYIWMRGCKVVSTRPLPTEDIIGPTGLPTEDYPSDHLALCALFYAESK